ncbi:MAG: acyl-CoA dehydrogenase family protein [Acetobacteraceae bacterium]
MRARAEPLDHAARFAAADVAEMRAVGCLVAPIPARFGGLGLGTEPAGASATLAMLRLIGAGSLAVGRVIEGHVNALRLVMRFGAPAQQRQAAADTRDGHLFALWIAEREPVLLTGAPHAPVLRGRKSFGSAVGAATRAIVSATDAAGDAWLVSVAADHPNVATEALAYPPQGMRAAGNGRITFHDVPGGVLGAPGDYLREPEFSAGAWRASAVASGGLDALIETACAQLRVQGRGTDPHQLARMGHALIARETASLWLHKAAHLAEGPTDSPDRQAYINLARIAVESAGLDALRLVQRSLGLAAFVPPNPIERLSRDLATLLRQPAPDEALTDGAAYYMQRDLPP